MAETFTKIPNALLKTPSSGGGGAFDFDTRAGIMAIPNPLLVKKVGLLEDGREGEFVWKAGDYTARVASDPYQGFYIANANIPVNQGCYVRIFSNRANVRWWGVVAGSTGNQAPAWNSAILLGKSLFIPNGEYRCTEAVVVTDYSHLEFETNNAILFGDHSGAGIEGRGKGTGERMFFPTLRSGRIRGGGALSYGVDCYNITYMQMWGTFITAVANGWRNGGGVSAYYNEAHGVTISSCSVGVLNGTLGNSNKMFGGSIKDVIVGTSDDNNSDNRYEAVAIETFTAFGSRVGNGAPSTFTTFRDCRYENPTTTGAYASAVAVRISTGCQYSRIRDNYISTVATQISDSGTGTATS